MALTVLIAVSMAICIVVTTFGNLLVVISFAVSFICDRYTTGYTKGIYADLYPINVKTAKLITPKFVLIMIMNPGNFKFEKCLR